MKERLIELLRTVDNMRLMRKGFSECADYLLANGVIVPPCKVGDFVYVIYGKEVQPTKVFSIKIESEDDHYVFYCKCMVHQGGARFEKFIYGKTVFLTKEEAEKTLAERSEGK